MCRLNIVSCQFYIDSRLLLDGDGEQRLCLCVRKACFIQACDSLLCAYRHFQQVGIGHILKFKYFEHNVDNKGDMNANAILCVLEYG